MESNKVHLAHKYWARVGVSASDTLAYIIAVVITTKCLSLASLYSLVYCDTLVTTPGQYVVP